MQISNTQVLTSDGLPWSTRYGALQALAAERAAQADSAPLVVKGIKKPRAEDLAERVFQAVETLIRAKTNRLEERVRILEARAARG